MTRLLDLFCGAGGAAMGYYRAGFTDIVGVDIEPQKRYPFKFVQGDALEYLAAHGAEFDLIHASPPCQRYSEATPVEYRNRHPDYIHSLRELLQRKNKQYIIENVENARQHLDRPIMLCGSMFGLHLWRHRYFEIYPLLFFLTPPCQHRRGWIQAKIDGKTRSIQVPILATGGGDGKKANRKTHRPRQPVVEVRWGMKIDWMTQKELSEAIPPVYTEWIGRRIMELETG